MCFGLFVFLNYMCTPLIVQSYFEGNKARLPFIGLFDTKN
jgi:hypothetical protein